MSIGPVSRRALTLCAAIALGIAPSVLVPRPAYAASQEKVSVAVGSFSGPGSKKVRQKVLEVLRKSGGYVVTDAEDIKAGGSQKSYAKMATAMGANAILVGVISRRHNLTVTVYGGKGERVDAVEIKGGGGSFGLLKAVDNEFEISIADPIARAKDPSAPKGGAVPVAAGAGAAATGGKKGKKKLVEEEEPELVDGELVAKDEDEDEEDEESGDSDSSSSSDEASGSSASTGPGLRPLELIVGLRGYNRNFKYTDARSPELHPYSLPLGPAVIASLRLYPIAFFRNDAWSHIGIQGRYEFGIATATSYQETTATGQTFTTGLNTSSLTYQVGLRGRFPLGKHELGVFMEYGAHSFILKGDEVYAPPKPYALVPDAKYTFIRPGIDIRLQFGKIKLGGHVAPRFLQSLKEIDLDGVWFPGATGSGLDFGVMGGYQMLGFLSIVGGVDVLQYGFDFNGKPDCAGASRCVIAGGATDTYLSGWVGAMLHLDGHAADED